jgi:membrane protease YdiL (CAAX protease family)
MTGACQTLVTDAPTLWIYFSVPRALDRVLADKAMFWCGVALAIGLSTFLLLTRASPTMILAGFPALCMSIVGVVLYAFIATAIGALATDPLETEPRRRIQVSMVYLFMTLAAMFGYALYTPSVWAKFAQFVLSALLVFALWQKVRDHAPFLLDPTAAPPPDVAVADGVIAVLAFFVLQGLFVLFLAAMGASAGASLLFAFAGSGLVVGAVTLFTFWRSGLPDLFRTLGLSLPQRVAGSLLGGIAGGLAGGLLARAYLWGLGHFDFLRQVRDETLGFSPDDRSLVPWLIGIAVGAAPIFEEFLFRAVLYRGFRRSVGPSGAAVFSAAVFAIVHPAIAAAPVFVLGLIAAVVYERSRSLVAPVAAHMTYNAIVVGFAWVGAIS